ncbi:MAG: acyl carrier protein [Neptuniibacter sp.]
MSSDLTTATICNIVTEALKTASKSDALSSEVTAASVMGDPIEWDSLAFVVVFISIGEAYGVELEDDDAFHFQSIAGIESFLNEVLVA